MPEFLRCPKQDRSSPHPPAHPEDPRKRKPEANPTKYQASKQAAEHDRKDVAFPEQIRTTQTLVNGGKTGRSPTPRGRRTRPSLAVAATPLGQVHWCRLISGLMH
ncbi:hypothetical protein SETIT_1G146300v2 [Setaria italica]|uniref:Uncharacterized protein n=1 Tax=Setaria italica TaxID=4555 RepID=A0A368PKU1_SETIT|nr:hypothetical protein SETIT_1G146300v2 [Setaria italica]